MEKIHRKLKITGKVQGVYYRVSAKAAAERLGIFGTVKNEPDGSVYAEAEGEKQSVLDFIDWCKSGSTNAVVEQVIVENGEIKAYTDFQILR